MTKLLYSGVKYGENDAEISILVDVVDVEWRRYLRNKKSRVAAPLPSLR